jgi:hypothetical protein
MALVVSVMLPLLTIIAAAIAKVTSPSPSCCFSCVCVSRS